MSDRFLGFMLLLVYPRVRVRVRKRVPSFSSSENRVKEGKRFQEDNDEIDIHFQEYRFSVFIKERLIDHVRTTHDMIRSVAVRNARGGEREREEMMRFKLCDHEVDYYFLVKKVNMASSSWSFAQRQEDGGFCHLQRRGRV